jgi:ubiquinone/menaquinone biosynthesis C-methylase UbiE
MFLSSLWKQHLTDPERGRYPAFEAYLETKLKEQGEGQGIDETAPSWAATAFRELVPYDRNRFGDYPMLLRPFLDKPLYRLRYEHGQIVGQQCLQHHNVLSPQTPLKVPTFATTNSDHAQIKGIYEQKSIAERYTRTRFSRPLGAVQHRIQVQTMNQAIKRYKPRSLLEIACGPARLTAEISGFEKGVAIDNSHEMLNIAKHIVPNNSQWTFLRADAFNLHLNQQFDLIYSFRFLRHFTLKDRRKIYSTVTNLLNESGLFIFDAVHYDKPTFVKYFERKGDIPIYDETYSKTDVLITELEDAGFEVLEIKRVVRHFYIQAAISRVTHVLRLNAIGEYIINLFEDLDYGRPLEWIVICTKK